MGRELEYVVLKPLLVDLGGEGLETLQPGHVLTEDEVVPWGRSVHALCEQGKLALVPRAVAGAGDLPDEDLLAELEERGLHAATLEATGPEIPEGARVFTAADADEVVANGVAAVKKPNPVHLWQQDAPFAVETVSGTMLGEPGGFVAHDPISGQVWPVDLDYVEAHYEPVAEAPADGAEAEPAAEPDGLEDLKAAELDELAAAEAIAMPADARSKDAKRDVIRTARAAKAADGAEAEPAPQA